MGIRVRGAKIRAKKRGQEAANEIVESNASRVEEGVVANKPDDELFVLDTTAVDPSKNQRSKNSERRSKRGKLESFSAKEEEKIQQLIDTHSPKALRKLVKQTRITSKRALKNIKVLQARPKYDIWGKGEDSDTIVDANLTTSGKSNALVNATKKSNAAVVAAAVATPTTQHRGVVSLEHVKIATKKALPAPTQKDKVVNVDIVQSGQSYNPDATEHIQAIMTALKVETKRKKAEKNAEMSVSQGMSAETRALLLDDTDTEDENSNNEEQNSFNEENNKGSGNKSIQKKTEKLTRAQRNKQKRVRAELYEIQERKRMKKFQHELRFIKFHAKQLEREEEEKRKDEERIERLKSEAERTKWKDMYETLADENPRYAPTYPIALPDELKMETSLRRIKSKGNLVTERMVSLVGLGMTTKKQMELNKRMQGKKQKVRITGKGQKDAKEGDILG